MRKALVATAAAALFGAAVAALSLHPSGLPVVSQDADVFNANRTVLVLLTGNNCPACAGTEQLLVKHAPRHPEFKIVKMSAEQDMAQPGIIMVVPGCDEPTYRNTAVFLNESNIEAFLLARAQSAAKEKPIVDSMAHLQAQKAEATKPFNDQLARLQAQAEQATAGDDSKIAALQQKANEARAPFNKAMAKQRALSDAAAQPALVQMLPIQAKETQALLPIVTEMTGVEQTILADAGLARLRAQLNQAQKAGDHAQMDALAAQYKAAIKPFQDRLAALKEKYIAISKQFEAQMAPLKSQQAAATKPYSDAIAALQAQADAAAKPFDEQVAALRAEEETILSPYRSNAQPLVEARDEAAAPFDAKIKNAESDLGNLIQADEQPDGK